MIDWSGETALLLRPNRVRSFAAAHPAFRPVDHAALWSQMFPDHPDAARIDAGTGIRLTSARTATDGFFFAALERTA